MGFLARLAALAAGSVALSGVAVAATVGYLLTPRYTSVAGGESQVMSAQFFDAMGRPVAGEVVRFFNDACGFFQNGLIRVDVPTDADGIASVTFTARNPPGITCWVNIGAGPVQLVIDVLTYPLAGVELVAVADPAEPRVGRPFSVTAQARLGGARLANVDIEARVIPRSISAEVAPEVQNTGEVRSATFEVRPEDRIGDFDVELDFRGRKARFAYRAPPNPLQDMWWGGPAENGWGVSVVQHGDMLFSVIYAYDAAGKPTWYVVPGGTWDAARTAFTGAVYAPRGSPFFAYDAARFDPGTPVGNARITFAGASRATLEYTIAGVAGRKEIVRQEFGSPAAGAMVDAGDMWWGGAAQNGWGIAVLQQYRTLFAVWFTYDAAGAPTWYVMPSGTWTDSQTYSGRLYRTTGSPWLGRIYDPAQVRLVDVGAFRLRFAGDTAVFEYEVEGRAGSLPLARQPF